MGQKPSFWQNSKGLKNAYFALLGQTLAGYKSAAD